MAAFESQDPARKNSSEISPIPQLPSHRVALQNTPSEIVFETGKLVLQEHGAAVIGMSLFNSYFTRDPNMLPGLISFAAENFSAAKLFMPDLPMLHTLEALNVPPSEAIKKVRLHANNLRNRCDRAISGIKKSRCTPILLNWNAEIESSEHYNRSLESIRKLYATSATFCLDARAVTEAVIQNKLGRTEKVGSEKVDIGIHFILKELAFLDAAPEIIGAPKIAYIYHNRWPIFEKYVGGAYDGLVRNKLGFLIVR